MEKKKTKIIGAIVGILLFALLMGGLTYAWFSWRSADIVIAGNTACFDIESTKGLDVSNDEMLLLDESDIISSPNITITDGMSIATFSANIDNSCNTMGYISIGIDVDTLQEEFQLDGTSHHGLKYALVKYDPEDYQTISVDALDGEEFRMLARGSIIEEGEKTIFHDKLPDDHSENNYMMIFYIDGDKTVDVLDVDGFDANIRVEATQLPEPNPIDDFLYILGDETSTVDSIPFYNEEIEEAVDIDIYPTISLEEDEILLVRYIGESSVVNIPDTYTIDGTTYNTVILSATWIYYYNEDTDYEYDDDYGVFIYNDYISLVNIDDNVKSIAINQNENDFEESMRSLYYNSNIAIAFYNHSGVTNMNSTFSNCTSLTEAPVIPNGVTSIVNTFSGCTNLTEAPTIPNSVTNMTNTFYGCTNLTEAPVIPNSVTNMTNTFYGCTNLTEAPVIPNSVTNMNNTFSNCTSLTKAPVIPNSVTNMDSTFSGCTSLVEAPVIPNSVTKMPFTFYGCTSLTGVVRINSSTVSVPGNNSSNPFYNTSLPITVEVPNGSTTYNSINTYKPNNVTVVGY